MPRIFFTFLCGKTTGYLAIQNLQIVKGSYQLEQSAESQGTQETPHKQSDKSPPTKISSNS